MTEKENEWLTPPYRYPILKECPSCGGTNIEIRNSLIECEGMCFDGFACLSCGRLIHYNSSLETKITVSEEIARAHDIVRDALDNERTIGTTTLGDALHNIVKRTGECWSLVSHIVREIVKKGTKKRGN